MGASVRQKRGDWYCFVRFQGERAAQKYSSKEEAELVAAAIRERIATGEFDLKAMKARAAAAKQEKEGAVTVREYFDHFERVHLYVNVRETTRKSYQSMFRVHILPALGDLTITGIDKTCLKDFTATLVEKNLSRDSVKTILAELAAMLNHAVEEGRLPSNPAVKLNTLCKGAPMRHEEIEPLTREEVPVFLNAVSRHATKHYALFLCAIHTGLRSGELAGLQWSDLDFNGGFLMVRRSISPYRKIHRPKNGRARRVDMSDELSASLSALLRTRKSEYLAQGLNEIPEWVFLGRDGGFMDMNGVKRRHFRACLAKAGLRTIRFHDLRHTFASLLIRNGESLAYVQEQLGHSSITMTVDTYSHLIPGSNREAVNRLPGIRPATRKTGTAD